MTTVFEKLTHLLAKPAHAKAENISDPH